MNPENENSFCNKLIRTLSLSLFLITIFLVMYQTVLNNPDNDAYWLVATGRYIVEHLSVPTINPWVSDSELRIIIQQPICAILNYLFYSISNDISTLWILATLLNIVMVLSLLYSSKKICNSRHLTLLSICIVELYCVAFGAITTRPFQITISMSVILLTNLEVAQKNKSYKRAAIAVALATLWQANYQMATLIAIPLFISCYTIGGLCNHICARIRKVNRSVLTFLDVLKSISLYVIWAFCSILNPYGIEGALYLLHSQKAMKLCKDIIVELLAVPIWSKSTLYILAIFILYILIYGNNFYIHFEKIFLTCGCSLAAMLAVRNYWMVIVTIIFVVPQVLHKIGNWLIPLISSLSNEGTESPHKKVICTIIKNLKQDRIFIYIKLATLISILSCVVLSISSSSLSVGQTDAFVSVINSLPSDASIYTTLNTGGLVEYA